MISPTLRSSISPLPRVLSNTEVSSPVRVGGGDPTNPDCGSVVQVCPLQPCPPTIAVRLWGMFTP